MGELSKVRKPMAVVTDVRKVAKPTYPEAFGLRPVWGGSLLPVGLVPCYKNVPYH